MGAKITPSTLVNPTTPLGYDGGDFVAHKADAAGRQVVRGENQLFSFKDTYIDYSENLNAEGNGDILSGATVPAGEIWVVTCIAAWNSTRDGCNIYFTAVLGGNACHLKIVIAAPKYVGGTWNGVIYLKEGDNVSAYIGGTIAGDDIYFNAIGYKMTKES